MLFLAMPSRQFCPSVGRAATVAQFLADFPGCPWCESSVSLLCWNFNSLLAMALNMRSADPNQPGVTHFLLLHDDVRPMEPHWAAQMLQIMRRHELGVLSAVIPLKNASGETSTAIDGELDPLKGRDLRKISVADVEARGGMITSREEPGLLINTGLLLVDLTQPWSEKLCFQTHDAIAKLPDGTFQARCSPEDWTMSRWLREQGVAFGATTRVKATHWGLDAWPNWTPEPAGK